MTQNTLQEAILEASKSGRLTCEKAHELAEKLNVSLGEIGTLCDVLKVRISSCQLGCF